MMESSEGDVMSLGQRGHSRDNRLLQVLEVAEPEDEPVRINKGEGLRECIRWLVSIDRQDLGASGLERNRPEQMGWGHISCEREADTAIQGQKVKSTRRN